MTVLRDSTEEVVPYSSSMRCCVWTSGECGGIGALRGLCVCAPETVDMLTFWGGGGGGEVDVVTSCPWRRKTESRMSSRSKPLDVALCLLYLWVGGVGCEHAGASMSPGYCRRSNATGPCASYFPEPKTRASSSAVIAVGTIQLFLSSCVFFRSTFVDLVVEVVVLVWFPRVCVLPSARSSSTDTSTFSLHPASHHFVYLFIFGHWLPSRCRN